MATFNAIFKQLEEKSKERRLCKQKEEQLREQMNNLSDQSEDHMMAIRTLYYKLAPVCKHRAVDVCSLDNLNCVCYIEDCRIIKEFIQGL